MMSSVRKVGTPGMPCTHALPGRLSSPVVSAAATLGLLPLLPAPPPPCLPLPAVQCGRLSVIGDYAGYANHFNLGALMEKVGSRAWQGLCAMSWGEEWPRHHCHQAEIEAGQRSALALQHWQAQCL